MAAQGHQITKMPSVMPAEAARMDKREGMVEKPVICTVLADVLNLRAGPGISFNIVSYLNKGLQVTPTLPARAAGLWVEVVTPAGSGWVNSSFITCEELK